MNPISRKSAGRPRGRCSMSDVRRSALKLLPLLAACAPALLLCSCVGTSVRQTWKAPEYQGPTRKIAVLAVDERGLVRQGFENRFVRELTRAGAGAFVTFDLLSLPEIKEDKAAAAACFTTNGADALLIVRLASIGSTYTETRMIGSQSGVATSGFEAVPWYAYYDYAVGFSYGSMTQDVFLETNLFDLKSRKREWFAVTETVVKENTDRVALMDPLVEKVVAAMRKDAVIR
jgi:hypothetical protein